MTYDNQYYAIVRHFIPNDFYDGIPKPYTYNFHLYKQADKIKLTVDILGEEGERLERQLANVAYANENLWGRLITALSAKDTTNKRTNLQHGISAIAARE